MTLSLGDCCRRQRERLVRLHGDAADRRRIVRRRRGDRDGVRVGSERDEREAARSRRTWYRADCDGLCAVTAAPAMGLFD